MVGSVLLIAEATKRSELTWTFEIQCVCCAALCYFTSGIGNGTQIVLFWMMISAFHDYNTSIKEQIVDFHKQTCMNSLTFD